MPERELKYSECSDKLLNQIKATYTTGTKPYRMAKAVLDKRKRKRARPKKQGVATGSKRGKYGNTKYIRKYGMKVDDIVTLLGCTNSITIRDLDRAGLLFECIAIKQGSRGKLKQL